MRCGQILRRLRRALDYSQEYVGLEIGICGKQVGRYEDGEAVPRIDVLKRWCRVLRITLCAFDQMCDAEGATWEKEPAK